MATRRVLSPADHEHFIEHGYVVVKNVAEPAAIAATVAELDGQAYAGTVGAADYKPAKAESVPRCYGPRFAAAIGELFGEPYSPGERFAGSHMPRVYEPGKAAAWTIGGGHIDDDYPTPMPAGWALGSFLFLTPVKPRGGAFIYYPGSHLRIRAAMSQSPWAAKIVSGDSSVIGTAREYLAEPGDLLLFHHLLGHSGSMNVADPLTRHALLARHHPRDRVVPGDKPFEAMSTLEKANSTRYLRQRFGDAFAMPDLAQNAASDAALQSGLGAGVVAHVPLHFGGRAWLFIGDAGSSGVRAVSTNDWLNWRAESVVDMGAHVTELSVFQRDRTVYLGGTSATGVTVLASDDLKTWRRVVELPGLAGLHGHYSTDYGTKLARGHFAFTREGVDGVIKARWAATFETALKSEHTAVAYAAPPGTRLVGFTSAPTLGESEFALVLDLAKGDASSRPYCVRGRDSVVFSGEATALGYAGDSPPRQIRVVHRARDYWLVTYLRSEGGMDRIFWGAIDWSASPVVLTEIPGATALRHAMAVVGLI